MLTKETTRKPHSTWFLLAGWTLISKLGSIKEVDVIRIHTNKVGEKLVRAKWIIRDQNGKELRYPSMSEALKVVDDEGWILKSNV